MDLIDFARRIDPADDTERETFRREVVKATAPMGGAAPDLVDRITECVRLMELATIVDDDPSPFCRDLVAAVAEIRPTLH